MKRMSWAATYMPTSLRGIANRARRDPKARFRDLYRLLNVENLRWCFGQLRKDAAPGVDKVTFREYEQNLEANLEALVERLKQKRYRARLVRRKYIPKSDGKRRRALGIPVLEDKLLQLAAAKILTAIYEQDFLPVNRGYRPGGDARETSKQLAGRLAIGKYVWVVDADVESFFDEISHAWMLRMLEERVDDRAFLRLIAKWLRAGVLEEDGKVVHPATGTPQGGIVSPVLANIYLHYALDLWFERVVKVKTAGQAMMMRYADDFVAAFERQEDAERFHVALGERLRKFDLKLSAGKTCVVRFDRTEPKNSGGFEFLGFRYQWERTRKGRMKVQRRTSPKRLQRSVARFTQWIKENRHERLAKLMPRLSRKLMGYWNYYGVTGNSRSLCKYWQLVVRELYKWLNRRSQKRSYTWAGLYAMLKHFGVPGPRITDSRQGVFVFTWA
jgi:group II intron reverse transcriptase/maturase